MAIATLDQIDWNTHKFRNNLQTEETYFLTAEDIASLEVSYSLQGIHRIHIGKSPEVRHASEINKLVHPKGVYTFRGQIVKWIV